MTASNKELKSKPLESKAVVVEVMPDPLVSMFSFLNSGVRETMLDYAFNVDDECEVSDTKENEPEENKKESVWLKPSDKVHTFLGISCASRKEILTLAKYAGPLDQIETCIRQAYKRKESHLQGTLMQAIKVAIIGLDQTVRNDNNQEVDEGMAERLLRLHGELFPQHQSEALEQARRAAPLEDEKTKKDREDANFTAVNQLFTAFINYDKDTLPKAINTFKELIKNSKPKVITDNRYYLNLLHLLFVAIDVLARRGGNLPRIDGEGINKKWDGKLGDRFCVEIIGATLEGNMPPRMKQMLRSGIYYLFYTRYTRKAARDLDVSGDLFHGNGTKHLHGVNSYFGICGKNGPGRRDIVQHLHTTWNPSDCLQNLLQALTSAPKILLYNSAELSQRADAAAGG